jgi:F-type H+-transporting ATPase subunit b
VISINLTLLVQMAIFLTVLVLLNSLLFQPILRTFDERARRVEDAESKARALEAETASRIATYEGKLAAARAAGGRDQEVIRRRTLEEEARLLRRVHEETGDMLGELRERIAREYRETSAALKLEAEALSRQVVARILGRSMQ